MPICQTMTLMIYLLLLFEIADLQACLVESVCAKNGTRGGIDASGDGSSGVFLIDLL